MTTKPTASKFRVKRTTAEPRTSEAEPAPLDKASADGAAGQTAPQEMTAATPSGETALKLDAISQEGFSRRQLRIARRVAIKNGLSPSTDIDAVRLLRMRGIDPFKRRNMLQLVVENDGPAPIGPDGESLRLSAPVQETASSQSALPPSPELSPIERRNLEISEIQADIARRRRQKLRMLGARVAFFVMLPTLLAGWYFNVVATPMYATKSEFLILQADTQGGSVGGLLSGTQFATSQDSIAVQSYLQSKDAMLRLDRDVGFKSHFTQSSIDPLQRLGENPTNEEAYRSYKDRVKVGYDPTEGVLRMEVIAADPQTSEQFSAALIQYAEERVNTLSEEKRGDQMADAKASFEKAERERRAAREALVQLQLEGSTLDPEAVIVGLRQQINNIELQVIEKELQLAALLDNARPNQSRVDGTKADIRRLKAQLSDMNARMTDASQGENSLAQLSARIQMAQADLATRDMLLQSALQQMEQTRSEANRQVRYLTTSVKPVAPQEASYPRGFENTILAFLIFAGIYLMVSLTASILREQVTS